MKKKKRWSFWCIYHKFIPLKKDRIITLFMGESFLTFTPILQGYPSRPSLQRLKFVAIFRPGMWNHCCCGMRRRATGSCLLNLRGTEMSLDVWLSRVPGRTAVQFSHDGIVRIRIILVLFAMWWTPQRHHDKRGNETKDYGLHLIAMTFHFLLWDPIYRVTTPLYTLYYSLLYCLLCTFKTLWLGRFFTKLPLNFYTILYTKSPFHRKISTWSCCSNTHLLTDSFDMQSTK